MLRSKARVAVYLIVLIIIVFIRTALCKNVDLVVGEKARQQFHSTLAQMNGGYIVSRHTSPIFSIKIPDTIIFDRSPIGFERRIRMTLNFKVNRTAVSIEN